MTSLNEEVFPDQASNVPVRKVTIRINGENRSANVEPRLLLAHLIRQGVQFDWDSYRLRHLQLRCMYGVV